MEGIGALAEFVDLARLLLPDLAANWRYLDLSRYEGGPRSVGSEIRVHTRGGALIIFASGDFQTQFARLNEIITRRLNAEQRARVELIDLSLPDPVVRLADRPGRSGL